MIKSINRLILLIGLIMGINAYGFGHLAGTVVDDKTNQPLAGANVQILGTVLGASRLVMTLMFPVWGYESSAYLALPVGIGVVSGLGANLRFYRTIMLDEMYKDYVRTAFAKGVGKPGVLFVHVLKNAMIPVITMVAGQLFRESIYTLKLTRRGVNIRAGREVNTLKSMRVKEVMSTGVETISEARRSMTTVTPGSSAKAPRRDRRSWAPTAKRRITRGVRP